MKYQLKDICSITKGVTGIMKSIPGKYPLVALSDERRSHNEFQFDANAVIVPLISSTGHGHASMKRVHYQEGKFALGNILCAVIPNDVKQLNAKYLHLYLQQFKDSLLVPLMKGAANVSLPMNKLAAVEIEVPNLERQLEIIALENEAAELKNELEERLISQDGDVSKLRQALLREAMQGKITKQYSNDGNAKDLLKKIKSVKTKLIKQNLLRKEKELSAIQVSEIPYEIPDNWIWCRLSEIFDVRDGTHDTPKYVSEGIPFITSKNISSGKIDFVDVKQISKEDHIEYSKRSKVEEEDILFAMIGSIGNPVIVRNINKEFSIKNVALFKNFTKENIIIDYFYWYLVIETANLNSISRGAIQQFVSLQVLRKNLFPLPPFQEQNRIVKRLEQLMQLCDELQYSIQQSKIENEKLLQGALRDALKKEEVAA
jgi:type I restriction enzyme, S subunit